MDLPSTVRVPGHLSSSTRQTKAVLEPDGVQVVQQGHPCHLYFDLEFATSANPRVQGEGLVDLLMRLVTQYFRCGPRIRVQGLGNRI